MKMKDFFRQKIIIEITMELSWAFLLSSKAEDNNCFSAVQFREACWLN